MKQFLCVVLLVIICSCHPKLVKINENNSLPGEELAVYFIGDNQFHLSDGMPTPTENWFSDKLTDVAIRSPQKTIFGPLVFESFLKSIDQRPLLVHMGDAADISCPQEMDRFFHTMKSYSGPWVFIPGNHDGFYTGNSQHKSENTDPWDNACLGKRLDKSDVIIAYLSNRFKEPISRDSDCGEALIKGTWGEKGFKHDYVAKIYPNTDMANKSFIVQQIRFTKDGVPIRIILIDTAQYHCRPGYIAGFALPINKIAGVTGEILADQWKVIEEMLAEKSIEDEILYIAGHHPLKKKWYSSHGLACCDTLKLKKMINKKNVKGYLSAHTHKGGKRTFSKDKYEWNIASFVDWPIGFSTLSVDKNNKDTYITEILYDREKTPPGIEGVCADVECDWKYPYNNFSAYTSYRNYKLSGHTGRYIQHYLLIAELELIIDTLRKFSPDENMTGFIKDKEAVIEEAKALFDKRVGTKSLYEIKALRFHVNCAEKKLREFYDSADGDLKERLNKYCWCQFWWAAKEDAQRQWDIIDITGQRSEW